MLHCLLLLLLLYSYSILPGHKMLVFKVIIDLLFGHGPSHCTHFLSLLYRFAPQSLTQAPWSIHRCAEIQFDSLLTHKLQCLSQHLTFTPNATCLHNCITLHQQSSLTTVFFISLEQQVLETLRTKFGTGP